MPKIVKREIAYGHKDIDKGWVRTNQIPCESGGYPSMKTVSILSKQVNMRTFYNACNLKMPLFWSNPTPWFSSIFEIFVALEKMKANIVQIYPFFFQVKS